MWILIDYKTVQVVDGIRIMSVMSQHEYDCKEGRGRVLSVSLHSGNMAVGDVVLADSNPTNWQPVVSARVDPTWKFACGKP